MINSKYGKNISENIKVLVVVTAFWFGAAALS
jgi:hypothetical protein